MDSDGSLQPLRASPIYGQNAIVNPVSIVYICGPPARLKVNIVALANLSKYTRSYAFDRAVAN